MEVVEAPFQIGLSCRAVKLEGLEADLLQTSGLAWRGARILALHSDEGSGGLQTRAWCLLEQ